MPPGLMPYYLEKGPMLLLMENAVNQSPAVRRDALEVLRRAEGQPQSIDWVDQVIPAFWALDAVAKFPNPLYAHVLEDWFGYVQDPQTQEWHPGQGQTTGYWVDYQGDVNSIVRRALIWALEMSLGLAHTDADPHTQQPVVHLQAAPVELLWICNTNWFETWVIQRPTGVNNRLVTVLFATPGHLGAEVSKTPIASSLTVLPGGASHAIPSIEADYQWVNSPTANAAFGPPQIQPAERDWATWVITHRQHTAVTVVDNTVATGMGEILVLRTRYTGLGSPVIVSPSLPAGGVTHDHRIP
jgi:hypothetical protein